MKDGIPGEPGSVCEPPEACCLPGQVCEEIPPNCCVLKDGTPRGPGSVCGDIVGCCFEDQTCEEIPRSCCEMKGGEPFPDCSFCVPCILEVTKECQVPATPGAFDCNRPIDELRMIWDGTQKIRIKAYKGDTSAALLADIDGIQIGDEVSVSGYAGSPNDVIWEIFVAGTSTKIGESMFHLSCSDNEMNGPEDCGNREGNGKRNDAGLINDWLLEGMVDATDTLDCTPTPEEPSSSCRVFATETLCQQRPTELHLRYNGGDCAQSSNTQAADKWSCSGDAGAGKVRIVAGNGSTIYLESSGVQVGDVLVLADGGNSLGSETFVNVFVDDDTDTLLQEITLHTSCSQPLAIGDRFGSMEVAGFLNEDQGFVQLGTEIVYVYTITNTGDGKVFGITVDDDVIGHVCDIPSLDPGQMETCTKMALVDRTTTNTVTVEGFSTEDQTGEKTCTASASTTVCVVEPPTDCCAAGRPGGLRMQYTGEDCGATSHSQGAGKVSCKGDPAFAPTVRIRASDKANPSDSGARLWFDDTVALNATFDVDAANAGETELKSETFIHVFGPDDTLLQSIKFHTSCSQPLFAGDQFSRPADAGWRGGARALPCRADPRRICR